MYNYAKYISSWTWLKLKTNCIEMLYVLVLNLNLLLYIELHNVSQLLSSSKGTSQVQVQG